MPGSPIVDLRNTYGAVFVGLLFNTMLTGLEIVQAWIYFNNYWDKDKKAFKLFVGFLTFVDVLSTIIGAYSIYWYLVLNFGDVESLERRTWAENLQSILNIFPGCAVQLSVVAFYLQFVVVLTQHRYYVIRIYHVSQSIIFPIMVVPLILGAPIFVTVIIARSNYIKSGADIQLILTLTRLWMGALVLVDISITVMMSWSLYHKRTGFARTNSMLKTLIAYTINSGFVLSTLGTGITIGFAVSPHTLIYASFAWVISKCHMNSLYAMLNTRNYVRNRSNKVKHNKAYNSFNLSSTRIGPQSGAFGHETGQPAVVTITLHRSNITDWARSKPDHPDLEDPKPGDGELQ